MKTEEDVQDKIGELNEQLSFLKQEKYNNPERMDYYEGQIHDIFLQKTMLYWMLGDEVSLVREGSLPDRPYKQPHK